MSIIAVGSACPDFSLPDADGNTVTRDSLKGKPYVLYFYPKDDTPGCTTEAIDFTARIDEFDRIGVEVFGVSPDPTKQHCKFRDKHQLKVRLLSDENKDFLQAFGVWAEKSMYGKTYMGVDRTTALIDQNGVVARVWPKVKVSGHAAEVLDAAKQLTTPA